MTWLTSTSPRVAAAGRSWGRYDASGGSRDFGCLSFKLNLFYVASKFIQAIAPQAPLLGNIPPLTLMHNRQHLLQMLSFIITEGNHPQEYLKGFIENCPMCCSFCLCPSSLGQIGECSWAKLMVLTWRGQWRTCFRSHLVLMTCPWTKCLNKHRFIRTTQMIWFSHSILLCVFKYSLNKAKINR